MNKIIFQGPYKIVKDKNIPSIFDIKIDKCIYIWTLAYKNKNYITYIGKTTRFKNRFLEHIKAYLSGDYEIIDIDQFKIGNKNIIWKGNFGHKGKIKNFEFYSDFYRSFSEIHKSIHPKILKLLNSHFIYVAPMDCNDRLLQRTEAALYRNLQTKKGFINTALEKNIVVSPRWPKEQPVFYQIEYDKKIMGLPDKIEI